MNVRYDRLAAGQSRRRLVYDGLGLRVGGQVQKVAAFLLERREGMEWPEARSTETKRLQGEVLKWLKSKGASAGASGTYKPEDKSAGKFAIEEAVDSDRSWWMVSLNETTKEGQRFATSISITGSTDRVSVYVTLEVGWTTARIMPVSLDPRAPRIVRDLLALPGRWYHGASTFQPLRVIEGFANGQALAAEIAHGDRSLPLIVVSCDNRQPVLPELDKQLAYDLGGLANVVRVDEDASWALTDVLGGELSCYGGSVRLYWPHPVARRDPRFHPLWTGERLRSTGQDSNATIERFRRQLRLLTFRAAALSIVRPREIDGIRDAAEQAAIKTLRERATSLEEYEQLAALFSNDAEKLRGERTSLRNENEDLVAQVLKLQEDLAKLEAERDGLEADRQGLLAHFKSKKQEDEADAGDAIEPSSDVGARKPPADGEVRFYKKGYSTPSHDVMRDVADCGCNNWENAHAADKARKGIIKHEGGRDDWSTMQHCASCTGGGMWKVRW